MTNRASQKRHFYGSGNEEANQTSEPYAPVGVSKFYSLGNSLRMINPIPSKITLPEPENDQATWNGGKRAFPAISFRTAKEPKG